MRFVVTFEMDNAAFEPPNAGETSRVLRVIADQVDQAADIGPEDGGDVRDVNGNTVGYWTVRR